MVSVFCSCKTGKGMRVNGLITRSMGLGNINGRTGVYIKEATQRGREMESEK